MKFIIFLLLTLITKYTAYSQSCNKNDLSCLESDEWKDEIRKKLIDIFQDDINVLTRVLYYLDVEEKAYEEHSKISPVWKTLKYTISSDAFKTYAKRLAEDTLKAEMDEGYRKTMNLIYSRMITPSNQPSPNGLSQKLDLAKLADLPSATIPGVIGFAYSFSLIPISAQNEIIKLIPQLIIDKHSFVHGVARMSTKLGGDVVMVTLSAVELSLDAIHNIYRWWNGEISGLRCTKSIVDSFVTLGAGMAGATGGAAIGSMAGPFGTVIGGTVGGMVSSRVANVIIDRLTQSIFALPKEESLERAYQFFGVKMSASNDEINSVYRNLCLKHHPDKGGKQDDFLMVQLYMQVIKLARGQAV